MTTTAIDRLSNIVLFSCGLVLTRLGSGHLSNHCLPNLLFATNASLDPHNALFAIAAKLAVA